MRLLLAACTLLLLATPARASSLPRVDFRPGESSVAVGVFDLNMDHAFNDRFAFGASYINLGGYSVGAVRGTIRLDGGPDESSWGLAFSGGLAPYPQYLNSTPAETTEGQYFFQPAVVWSTPFLGAFRFRASLGPIVFSRLQADGNYRYINSQVLVVWPNLELAYRFKWGEITLGGNAIAGLRLIF